MKTAVLFSGGWDSAACVIKLMERGEQFDLFFVNYGQTYVDNERAAVSKFITHFGLQAVERTARHIRHDQPGRNFMFIAEAAADGYERVISGSRNVLPWFDKYRDSNWVALKLFAWSLKIRIELPVVGQSKRRIINTVRQSYPHQMYSCYANKTDLTTCNCVNCMEIKHLL